MVVDDEAVARRRRRARLERLRGARVVEVPLSRCSDREAGAVWIDQAALASLPAHVRAVPPHVAVARLSASIASRRTVGVYWGSGRERLLVSARRGRLVADSLCREAGAQRPWVLLTEPDRTGWRLLARAGGRQWLRPRNGQLPKVAPETLLLIGAALAVMAPGSYPPLEQRASLRHRLLRGRVLFGGLFALGIASVGGCCWLERRNETLREECAAVRARLEAAQWQRQGLR